MNFHVCPTHSFRKDQLKRKVVEHIIMLYLLLLLLRFK